MVDKDPGRVQVLALTPTRELALQVSEEFRRMGCSAQGINVVTVYGGASIRDQIQAVKEAEIIVATPGRMLDLLRRKATELSSVRLFVLDEADEMLSMGFEKELHAIREFLPEERQSLMFSATVTEDIKSVAASTLFYPEYLSFSNDSVGASQIDHYYFLISGVGRLRDLYRLISAEEPDNAIIFCNTKDDSFRVANFLKQQGFDADVLNGDLPQSEREKVLGRMREGALDFLVATDIAARGIDISFLPCVINYVLPESADSYVHRTGRTGRAGRHGEALSLVSPQEIGMFYQLRRAYKMNLVSKELPSEEELIGMRERRALNKILDGLDAEEELEYGRYLTFADSFSNLPDHRSRLAKLIASFVRARDAARAADEKIQPAEPPRPAPRVETESPAAVESAPAEPVAEPAADRTEPEPREPQRKRRRRRRGGDEGDERADVAPSSQGEGPASERRDSGPDETPAPSSNGTSRPMTRLRLNVGKDRLGRTGDLLALVADLSGLELSDLGRAKVFKEHAWVEVREDMADDVIAAIDHEKIDDHVLQVSR